MSFGRAWSPTLGRRKSPLGARQALQRKPEEKRLSPARHLLCLALALRGRPSLHSGRGLWPRRAFPPRPPAASPATCPRALPWRPRAPHAPGAEPSAGNCC